MRFFWILFMITLLSTDIYSKLKRNKKFKRVYPKRNGSTTQICLGVQQTAKARHKSCFLRPDTGPCRADIVQWYYDVRQKTCYRFFWGGCQGNGNRFETKHDCMEYCALNMSNPPMSIPHFCSLNFDYGTCFGYFNRWGWNTLEKACKRYLYSGCGGNQNNFQSLEECTSTCLRPPLSTFNKTQFTTCIPIEIPEIM